MPMESGRPTKRVLTVAAGDPPALDAVIAARLSLHLAAARDLIERGSVYVNGRRTTRGKARLAPGTRLLVYETPPRALAPSFRILHRDSWIVVVEKPAGMPVQATRAEAAQALDAKVVAVVPGARLLHRLDREVSGLVLFAASAAACAPLQMALRQGAIERRYLALVTGGQLRAEQGQIALRIARRTRDRRLRVALPVRASAGKAASSRFRTLAHQGELSAVDLALETGRTHQLRVHLAAIGHPILGDTRYGGPAAERLFLHAYRLVLTHPSTSKPLRFTSPPPAEFAARLPAPITLPG